MITSTATSNDRVVVAGWDGSDRGRDAVALAGAIARELGAGVRIVHAYARHRAIPAFEEAFRVDAEDMMRRAPVELAGVVKVTRKLIAATSPAEGLQRFVEASGALMLVVGSTHRGPLGRVVPGTVASHLLHGSPCAVAVAPAGYADSAEHAIRTVAVAFDGSRESCAAVDQAVALATRAGASLRAISVAAPINPAWIGPGMSYPPAGLELSERNMRKDQLDALMAALPVEVQAEGRLREGDPPAEIVDECAHGVDLLVMGSRGYGTVRRVLIGSVSSRVIRSARCPVLVVPHAAVADAPVRPDVVAAIV